MKLCETVKPVPKTKEVKMECVCYFVSSFVVDPLVLAIPPHYQPGPLIG